MNKINDYKLAVTEGVTTKNSCFIKTTAESDGKLINENYSAICVNGDWYEKSKKQNKIESEYLKLKNRT